MSSPWVVARCTAHLTPPLMPTTGSPIFSEGNELLVQFVSDLSVTADGFSASYRTLPQGTAKEGAGKNAQPGPPLLGPGPKPGAPPKVKPEPPPTEKAKDSLEAKATLKGPGKSGKGEEEGDTD